MNGIEGEISVENHQTENSANTESTFTERLILSGVGGALLGGIYYLVSIPSNITDPETTNIIIALLLFLVPPLAVLGRRYFERAS